MLITQENIGEILYDAKALNPEYSIIIFALGIGLILFSIMLTIILQLCFELEDAPCWIILSPFLIITLSCTAYYINKISKEENSYYFTYNTLKEISVSGDNIFFTNDRGEVQEVEYKIIFTTDDKVKINAINNMITIPASLSERSIENE